MLQNEELTCCIIKDGEIYKSRERGVKPLLSLLDNGHDVKNATCADKVVGMAAAYLYVLLGVSSVYACIISEKAKSVFEKYHITYGYDECVPAIINRTGDGFCPMESAVSDAEDPEKALVLIKQKLKQLHVGN